MCTLKVNNCNKFLQSEEIVPLSLYSQLETCTRHIKFIYVDPASGKKINKFCSYINQDLPPFLLILFEVK